MKKITLKKFTLEDLMQDYTQNDDGNIHNIVFNVKPEQRMELINLGFSGDEKIIRITKIRKSSLLEFRLWYADGKNCSWTIGSSRTLVGDVTTEMGKKIQQMAEKISGKRFDPYTRD